MQLFNSIDSNSDGYVSSPEFIASANATRLYARLSITCVSLCFLSLRFISRFTFLFLLCSASLPGGLRSALDRFATIDTKGLGVVRWRACSNSHVFVCDCIAVCLILQVSRDDFLDAFEGFTDANFLAWLTAATRAVAAEPPRKVSISSPAGSRSRILVLHERYLHFIACCMCVLQLRLSSLRLQLSMKT